MKIGYIGLGKLGLPVALATEDKGHTVYGCDISNSVLNILDTLVMPYKEVDSQNLLNHTHIIKSTPKDMVSECDLIFVPIQTPHEKRYEGTTKLPPERKDFDYTWLLDGIKELAKEALLQKKDTNIIVVSTCLPGTYKRDIEPLLNKYVHYTYNPFFIAMGTVIPDYLNPEFVLIGSDGDKLSLDVLKKFYKTIHNKPLFITDITTAEGIKVFYNTFITTKTVLGNLYGEMAYKLGMNVDDIYDALSLATDRVISNKYLRSGMGDGGGCHPRDNIALSWVARNNGVSHDFFEDLMLARERHTAWLADLVEKEHNDNPGFPVIVLGRSFKPETNIETGSPAKLLSNILEERGVPHEHVENVEPDRPSIFFIATKHERYKNIRWPADSVVIDPFRYIPDSDDVFLIRIGQN